MVTPSHPESQKRSIRRSQPGDYNPHAVEADISWHIEDSGDGGFGEGPLGSHYLKPVAQTAENQARDYRGIGPKNYRRSDQRIYEDACELLTLSPEVDARDIELSVSNGEIVLKGTVPDHHMRLQAEKCLEDCPGAFEIVNQLKTRLEGGSHA